MDWIAGKTGTPTFPNDDRSLNELWRLCGRGAAKTKSEQAACGPLRPYKWYVAAYRTERDNPHWTKVIGVLTERNWLRDTGRIHGAGDHGPNPAAEIAMQIAGRHAGFIPGDAR
jgi:ribosomal protein L37E